jgi:hypothetical protein
MPFIASFSVDFPFFDSVTSDGNDVRKEEYPKVNAASCHSMATKMITIHYNRGSYFITTIIIFLT